MYEYILIFIWVSLTLAKIILQAHSMQHRLSEYMSALGKVIKQHKGIENF